MRGALAFLTIVPWPFGGRDEHPGFGAAWFPLVGALLGAVAALLVSTGPLGPALALAAVTLLTGALHEDGFADTCDAIRKVRSRERMLAILHDSRIGAHGATALVVILLLRWQSLAALTGSVWLRLPCAFALSRAMMVFLAALTPAAAPGLGERFRAELTPPALVVVGIQVLACLMLCGGPPAVLLLALSQLALGALVRPWLIARLGGFTGDGLGFLALVSETLSLAVFTWV